MSRVIEHPSDTELLRWVDGELSPGRRAEIVKDHVSACWLCRARVADLESTILDVMRLHRREQKSYAAIDGPRALLRARLAALRPHSRFKWAWNDAAVLRPAALMTVCLLVLMVFSIGILRSRSVRADSIPNGRLTPGATVPVSVRDVCSSRSPNDPAVPEQLKRQVLQEYGMGAVSSQNYEIDYLVTPKLGGARVIQNLWPEPDSHTPWNARRKDVLEDRLNYLVCSGQLDLATAQREVATNWVAAYRKYF